MAQYAVYLCGGPSRERVRPFPDCPTASKHTPCPTGYLERAEWADKKSKSHDQVRCDGCGRYVIWRRKKK